MLGKMNFNHISTTVLFFFMLLSVQADFDFTVRFYEYWNPTGLCAECGTNGVPVCCDDPLLTESCQNTRVFRCDTRFRFILRPYNAPLETAPNGDFPYFTRSPTNENHETFVEGDGGFLGIPNPNTITNTSPWTGRIQFYVDAFDRINNNQAPNETEGAVDRFLINLQLGTDLTEQTTYTGIYNISQLAMSFQVECSENYYGSNCTTFCEPVVGVYNCTSDGNIVCVEENRDPSTNCMSCLDGFIGEECRVMDPCLSNPCENEATCTHNNITREYQCQCANGFEGMNCDVSIESSSVNVALIGGVVGGVIGILVLIVIIILVVVIVCLTLQLRTKHRGELDISENDYSSEQVKLNTFNTNTGGSADHFFDNTLYGSGGDVEKPATTGAEYSQLNQNLKVEKNPPAKHTMPVLSTTVNGTSTSPSKLELAKQPTYDSANHHTGFTSPPLPTSTGHPPPSNYDIAYPITSPVSQQQAHPQPQIIHNLPSSDIYSDIVDNKPQKESTQPVHVSADSSQGAAVTISSIYDDINSPPQHPTNVYDYATTDEVKSPQEEKQTPKSLSVYESADLPPLYYEIAHSKQGDVATSVAVSQQPDLLIYDTADDPPLNHNESSLPVTVYDSADTASHPPQQTGHTYDYASNSEKPQITMANTKTRGNLPMYDYADTAISVSLPKQQLTYDYVDQPVQVVLPKGSEGAPPTHEYLMLESATYTNTMPGEITKESASHYDLGQ